MNCGICSIVRDFDSLCDNCFDKINKEDNIIKFLLDECGDGWYLMNDTYMRKCKLMNNKKLKKIKRDNQKYVFITLQDFKRRYSDIEKLKLFCEKIKFLYDDYFYVIESGSNEKKEDCNYHIHLLAKIKDNKNHKRNIKIEYSKLFNDDITEKDYYQVKQWRKSDLMPSYDIWLNEKIDYLNKGTHSKNTFPSICGNYLNI